MPLLSDKSSTIDVGTENTQAPINPWGTWTYKNFP